jgi:hypothetical protein
MGCTVVLYRVPVWAVLILSLRYRYELCYSFQKRKSVGCTFAFHKVPVWAVLMVSIRYRYGLY